MEGGKVKLLFSSEASHKLLIKSRTIFQYFFKPPRSLLIFVFYTVWVIAHAAGFNHVMCVLTEPTYTFKRNQENSAF